jgi:fatty acid desaturase
MTTETRDYSLIGPAAQGAAEQGLVAAEWYHTDIPRKQIKTLMRRTDGPALRNTAIWLALLAAFGIGVCWAWGSWWCAPLIVVYGVLYGSASDARWHESGHGTAFKTMWINEALYQLTSFLSAKEPTLWRWSHARHHTDTLIVGRDREIVAMRPPDLVRLMLSVLGIREATNTIRSVLRHASGCITEEEATFLPLSERTRVFNEARVWLVIYAAVVGAALTLDSWIPLVLIGLPSIYGGWLAYLIAVTQHVGLAEDVLDHRLNSRTIYMNPVLRFLFCNMNYHVEHHMFPMVPFHALPALHQAVREDMPPPYPSLLAAYREILPTLWRQRRDPSYHVRRELPGAARPFRPDLHDAVVKA